MFLLTQAAASLNADKTPPILESTQNIKVLRNATVHFDCHAIARNF
jgi:hypothetical protein